MKKQNKTEEQLKLENENAKEFWKKNSIGLIATSLFALTGLGIYAGARFDQAKNKQYLLFLNDVAEKLQSDIKSNQLLSYYENEKMELTAINFFNNEKKLVGDSENCGFNVYGYFVDNSVENNQTENKSFKLQYVFDSNFNIAHYSDLQNYNEGKNGLKLKEIIVGDQKAIDCGFNSKQDFEQLTAGLNSISYSNDEQISNYMKQVDMFIPYYSQIEVVEQNGKHYGVMFLDGLCCDAGRASLKGTFDVLLKNEIPQTLTSADLVKNIEKGGYNTKYTEQTIICELDSLNYTTDQIRQQIVEKINSNDQSLKAQITYYSTTGPKEMVAVEEVAK